MASRHGVSLPVGGVVGWRYDAAVPTPAERRSRVLYLCAWGRSGTTVLDRVLGQLPGCFSVGELRSLWDADPEVRRCGCGKTVAACDVWGPVLDDVLAPPGPRSVAEVRRLRDEVARSRHLLGLWRRGHRSEAAEAYGALLVALYRALLDRTGAELVVDSSKHPAEALVLAGRSDLDLSVLHVVRDPRAVAFSWSRTPVGADGSTSASEDRPPPRGPLSSSAWWTAWNAAAEWLVADRAGTGYVRLRYEDVVADPLRRLGPLVRRLGHSPDELRLDSDGAVDLAPSHTVAGNPNRFAAGPVRLVEDRAWVGSMATSARWLATVPALPLMSHYGYALRAPGRDPADGDGRS